MHISTYMKFIITLLLQYACLHNLLRCTIDNKNKFHIDSLWIFFSLFHLIFFLFPSTFFILFLYLLGLLMYLSDGASELLPLKKPWIAFIYILFFFLIVSTFISHTIVSIMLMPLITRIGVSMQIPEVIVIGSTLAISGGMILSSSSFPNVYSLYLQDDFNTNYLKKNDYYRVGLPISVITIFLIATIGFVFINLVIQN